MASKKGLGWPWDYKSNDFNPYQPYTTSNKITWLFNWELWVPEGVPQGIEWVPCVRTAGQAKDIIPFLTDITQNRGVKIRNFLGFNEPEITDQANLSVDEAVRLYKEIILPAKKKFGFRLGSPGMTSDVSKCKPWLDEFFGKLGAEDKKEIDFLVVHWYGRDFGGLKWYLEEMYRSYGLPLWLNEVACGAMGGPPGSGPDVREVEAFIKQAIPWLDSCQFIERYAYFGNGQGKDVGDWVGKANNFTEGGGLSNIGKLYCEI